jgi:hypothetical protein
MSEEKTAIEMMAEDLRAIRDAMERLERYGINKELMVIYIQKKSRVNKTNVEAVLDAQRDFLDEAFKTEENQPK